MHFCATTLASSMLSGRLIVPVPMLLALDMCRNEGLTNPTNQRDFVFQSMGFGANLPPLEVAGFEETLAHKKKVCLIAPNRVERIFHEDVNRVLGLPHLARVT